MDVWASRSVNWVSNLSIIIDIWGGSLKSANVRLDSKSGKTYPLEVHAFHGFIHASDDGGHVASHLSHRYGRFHAAGDGVYPTREAEEIERFALLPNCI